MIVDITLMKGQGVFHLGPTTTSTESNFLKKLARSFGYQLVIRVGDKNSPINAYMVPDKIFQMTGSKWKKTENDTLNSLSNCKELQKYRRLV